jgi:hypothetical protein
MDICVRLVAWIIWFTHEIVQIIMILLFGWVKCTNLSRIKSFLLINYSASGKYKQIGWNIPFRIIKSFIHASCGALNQTHVLAPKEGWKVHYSPITTSLKKNYSGTVHTLTCVMWGSACTTSLNRCPRPSVFLGVPRPSATSLFIRNPPSPAGPASRRTHISPSLNPEAHLLAHLYLRKKKIESK